MYSLKIPIPHPFFLSTATQYFLPRVTSHKPLFDIYHNQLKRLFHPILFFLLQLPGYPHILVPSKDDVKPIKHASKKPMFNREISKSAPTKRKTIFEGNAVKM